MSFDEFKKNINELNEGFAKDSMKDLLRDLPSLCTIDPNNILWDRKMLSVRLIQLVSKDGKSSQMIIYNSLTKKWTHFKTI